MNSLTVVDMILLIIVASLLSGIPYEIGKNSVRDHIKVYGCEKTISVYNIEMEKKK